MAPGVLGRVRVELLQPSRIYELLKERRVLAMESFKVLERGKVEVRKGPVLRYASRLFGFLPPADRYVEPPAAAYRAVAYSVPGLMAMLARWRREREGTLVNEIVAIEGPGGVGKSSFAYWLARLLGGVIVYDYEGLVGTVLGLVEREEWVPVLVLDDVATFVSKYWYLDREERAKMRRIFETIELAKDFSGVIVLTARSFDGIAKRLRELTTVRGRMKTLYHGGYLLGVIEWFYPGERLPRYLDVYWPTLRIPDEDWEEIMRRRRERIIESLAGAGGVGGEGEASDGGE